MIALLRASHFQPTTAVTGLTTALALSAGRGWGTAWVVLAVLTGQLSVGWSNDYLDRHRDRAAQRTDKPIVAGTVAARLVLGGAVAAAVVCVPLSLASGWRAGSVHLAAVGAAWLYNAWLKHTVASPLPYTAAFALLPSFITLGLPGHPLPAAWATATAALMGTGAHFVNALRDQEDDLVTGVRGLIQRIGPRWSLSCGAALIAGATVVLAFSGGDSVPVRILVVAALAAVLGIVIFGIAGKHRLAWGLTLGCAALNVAIVIVRGGALVT